ncbi:hypothetical protein [Celerinatantimonas sp. MCCC 1A17872]|uniref:rolling circle replication-associated protein n=1 Tax=Celerinatantimonas sp. MCCC 1A17872 TaxID=3177514 RepID=UPI0038C420EA
MSKPFIPTNRNQYSFRGYRVNSHYHHDYDHLARLVAWYGYLDVEHYRYSVASMVLKYDEQDAHLSTDITKLLKSLNEKFKVKGESVPIHYLWKLEYRISDEIGKGEATGWHYHIIFCINRDIVFNLKTSFIPLVKECWKHGEIDGERYSCMPKKVKNGKRKAGNKIETYELSSLIINTQTEHYMSEFHHMSYLTKKDDDQALPDDYHGCSFKTSRLDKSKLEGHSSIKRHQNTIRLPAQDVRCVEPSSVEQEFEPEIEVTTDSLNPPDWWCENDSSELMNDYEDYLCFQESQSFVTEYLKSISEDDLSELELPF